VPGVHAVITGADTRTGPYGRAIKDMPILAHDTVFFFGQRVAAVAADDEDIAQRALELIEVEYEELPAVLDALEALKDNAPILHPDFNTYPGAKPIDTPSNGYHHVSRTRGDPAKGFAEADVIVERVYKTPKMHQSYLEAQSVLVNVRDGHVDVWACGKAPYDLRGALAVATALPESEITLNPVAIGGDFGGKATPVDLPIAYFLSKQTGRPVRMVLDYIEEFMAANPRHATITMLKTGVKRDGTLTAHEVRYFVDSGAYAGFKPGGIIGGHNQAAGPYKCENSLVEATHVYTNTVPGGHMRAPGDPQGIFAIESHMDEIAAAIGMDPVELRLKNLIESGEETAYGAKFNDVRGKECLRAAVDASPYRKPKPRHAGRGIAVADRISVGGTGTLDVTLHADGSVLLSTPLFEQGTGTHTTHAQVVAEELGLDMRQLGLEVWTTDAVAYDSGLGGARGTRVNTITAWEAAQATKRALFALAARVLGWPEEGLVYRDGEVRRTDTEEAIGWPELVRRSGAPLTARGHYNDNVFPPITGFVAQVAEVEVDPETGAFKVLDFTTAHDVGQVINPVGHQGQINGGLIQGLGYAVMEDLRIEDGRVTALSFGDYKIPSAGDIPPLRTVILEPGVGVGPYHVMGIGESSIGPVAAAIANAVYDAVGVRILELPVTAEKIYAALKARDGTDVR
jgi:CO/xanthine dehydrogenase Mo-binding subunit